MQKAVKRFSSPKLEYTSVDSAYEAIRDFWLAITIVLEEEWRAPRKNSVTKGVGVFSLCSIAADLTNDARTSTERPWGFFAQRLCEFINDINWSNTGDFRGLGGVSGVTQAVNIKASKSRADRQRKGIKSVG